MKIIVKSLLFLFILLMLFSCSDSEDTNKEASTKSEIEISKLVGKWYYDYYTINGERFELDEKAGNDNCPSLQKFYIEFTDDGSFIQFFVQHCNPDSETSEYTIDKNRIFLSSDGNVYSTITITKLNENELVFEAEEDSMDDDGIDEYIQYMTR